MAIDSFKIIIKKKLTMITLISVKKFMKIRIKLLLENEVFSKQI
jgi:hypothetical protein